ncbi:MAG: phosphatidylglycerophosphatase A [Deltaproteobacteria bacterium]|nr:phosphatidylglycerophosphatase A [Deltaproteobacteria bacterium]
MIKRLTIFLSTGAYAGFIPVMPGTFGTLWGVPLAYLLSGRPLHEQAVATLAVTIASVLIAGRAARYMGANDPQSIVCDEIAGFLTSILLIPFSWFNAILVFILFRFFDILKPYPIRLMERRIKGGAGIVLDDIMAGVYANISAHVILWGIR